MSDVVDRAKAALELWDNTVCVEITVLTGMDAAEDAYRDAPELVRELVADVERLQELLNRECQAADNAERQVRDYERSPGYGYGYGI